MVPIKNYENYFITEQGEVINSKTGRTLKPSLGANGYYRVNLRKNGKTKTVYIHRLVAETFIPNPNNYNEVNHIDENKANNAIENLEWVSHKANINHATCIQRRASTTTSRYGRPILCIETGQIYASATAIQNELGYGKGTIWLACNGGLKTAYGYHWVYANDSSQVLRKKSNNYTSARLQKEEVYAKKEELKTWKAVAQYYNIGEDTLRRVRNNWQTEEKQKNSDNNSSNMSNISNDVDNNINDTINTNINSNKE